MKLCQKCYDDCVSAMRCDDNYRLEYPVAESDCTFWAHSTLNVVNKMFKVANDQIEKLLRDRH